MKKITRVFTVLTVMMTMLFGAQTGAFAAAPTIEDIEHTGKGRIEVDFHQDVQYKNSKVVVKDTKGNKYKVKNIYRDDDDMKFTIKNYKKGRTYKITIKGVRKQGTSKYGKVTGKVKIPKASSTISRSKAISIAENHAKKTWGATGFYNEDAEKDYYNGKSVWEVDFEGTENGATYEYEYKINRSSGKIMYSNRELDD